MMSMTDEEIEKLIGELVDARAVAMDRTVRARIPECGDFGGIAQTLDAALPIIRQLHDEVKALRASLFGVVDVAEQAIEFGDWVVDGACEPDAEFQRAKKLLSQEDK